MNRVQNTPRVQLENHLPPAIFSASEYRGLTLSTAILLPVGKHPELLSSPRPSRLAATKQGFRLAKYVV